MTGMNRLMTLALIGLTTTALSATAALAAGARGDHRPGFESIDRDGDGQITEAELAAPGAARFAAADADGNGRISLDEMQARARDAAGTRAGRMFARLDADGDGGVTPEELSARRDPSRMIARLDTDGSGTVSRPEFEAARERMHQRHGDRKAP